MKDSDKNSFAHLAASASTAADNAETMLVRARERFNAEKASDEEKARRLNDLAEKAQRSLFTREQIADAIKARLETGRTAVQAAINKHAGAVAAAQAAKEGLRKVEEQVNGPLAQAVTDATTKLEGARKVALEIPKSAEKEQAPLKHAVEAEGLVLKQLEESELKLQGALNAGRIDADEAHDDATADDDKDDAAPEIDFLIRSSKANLTDKERTASEAEGAHQSAAEALNSAQRDLTALLALRAEEDARSEASDDDRSDASDDEDDDHDAADRRAAKGARAADMQHLIERCAAEEARVADLQHVTSERRVTSEAAALAVQSAREELAALEAEHQARSSATPVVRLVRAELAIVDECLKAHQEKEREMLDKVKLLSESWTSQKVALEADLHRACLKVATCEAEVNAAASISETFKSTTPITTPRGSYRDIR